MIQGLRRERPCPYEKAPFPWRWSASKMFWNTVRHEDPPGGYTYLLKKNGRGGWTYAGIQEKIKEEAGDPAALVLYKNDTLLRIPSG